MEIRIPQWIVLLLFSVVFGSFLLSGAMVGRQIVFPRLELNLASAIAGRLRCQMMPQLGMEWGSVMTYIGKADKCHVGVWKSL